jgi:AhpD family alkylhydroperoxidase
MPNETMDTPWFFDLLREKDPSFEGDLEELFSHVRTDGALSAKTKALMVLALDAAAGQDGGVTANARLARKHGATDEEIVEAIEVATVAAGVQALSTATHAFPDRDEYLGG